MQELLMPIDSLIFIKKPILKGIYNTKKRISLYQLPKKKNENEIPRKKAKIRLSIRNDRKRTLSIVNSNC